MGKQWKKEGKLLKAQQKGRLFHKLAKEIQQASLHPGPRLERALAAAKEHSLPKETIQKALGQISGSGAAGRKRALYEGFAPHRVAVIADTLTDNRARLAAALRLAFQKRGGILADKGSCLHLFEKGALIKGRKAPPFDLEIEAIEAGASQCFARRALPRAGGGEAGEAAAPGGARQTGDEGRAVCSFFAPLKDMRLVESALSARGWLDLSSRPFYLRKAKKEGLSENEIEEARLFLKDLKHQPDIMNVYSEIDDF